MLPKISIYINCDSLTPISVITNQRVFSSYSSKIISNRIANTARQEPKNTIRSSLILIIFQAHMQHILD